MACGFLYLVAIIDWASRAVLAWRLSNTNDASFGAAALGEALLRFGKPRIFNTDQGLTIRDRGLSRPQICELGPAWLSRPSPRPFSQPVETSQLLLPQS
jgi:transposase InsO family protein